jgi:hypothetical protein
MCNVGSEEAKLRAIAKESETFSRSFLEGYEKLKRQSVPHDLEKEKE